MPFLHFWQAFPVLVVDWFWRIILKNRAHSVHTFRAKTRIVAEKKISTLFSGFFSHSVPNFLLSEKSILCVRPRLSLGALGSYFCIRIYFFFPLPVPSPLCTSLLPIVSFSPGALEHVLALIHSIQLRATAAPMPIRAMIFSLSKWLEMPDHSLEILLSLCCKITYIYLIQKKNNNKEK